jgi:malate permease and related proteins
MDNFLLIAFCIGAGMLLKALKLTPADAHKSVNNWVLYIALPAASFRYIPGIKWSWEMFMPALSSIVVWIGSWIFMELYCRYKKYGQRSRSTLELASGYSNTSFVGFPLVAAYFGEQHLSIAIISDQVMFVLLSTVGVITALKGGDKKSGMGGTGSILKRLITFPPFIGCVLALSLSQWFDLSASESFFEKLAQTLTPLALFSVGLQLKFKGWRQEISQISMAVFYKLIIAPALVLGIVLLTGLYGPVARVSVFEAAMPTVITSSIIAERFRLNTRLINLIIGVSILLGLLTTALWFQAMSLMGI